MGIEPNATSGDQDVNTPPTEVLVQSLAKAVSELVQDNQDMRTELAGMNRRLKRLENEVQLQ